MGKGEGHLYQCWRSFCPSQGDGPGEQTGEVFRAGNPAWEAAASALHLGGCSILMALALSNLCFQQTEVMTEFIQSCQVLNSPELRELAVALVGNALPGLAVEPWGRSQQGALVEMAVHVAAVLLCGHSPVLQPLRNLAFQPHTMQVRARSSGALQHLPGSCLYLLDPLSQQQFSDSLAEL